MIMTGINGALGLYSTVKGLIDSSEAKKKQSKLRQAAQNEENAWYRRNYYGNFMDNSASKAAIKRVENTLRRNNAQERARSVITGSTPEMAIARNEQGLRTMENVVNNLAALTAMQGRISMQHTSRTIYPLSMPSNSSCRSTSVWQSRQLPTVIILCRMLCSEQIGEKKDENSVEH